MAGLASKAGTSLSLGQRLWNALATWTIRNSGYQKLGLRYDDLLNEDHYEVREAVRRLPENEKNLRNYRLKRALDLDTKRMILSREEWTKPEEDVRYLEPYVKEVKLEMKERKEWDAK